MALCCCFSDVVFPRSIITSLLFGLAPFLFAKIVHIRVGVLVDLKLLTPSKGSAHLSSNKRYEDVIWGSLYHSKVSIHYELDKFQTAKRRSCTKQPASHLLDTFCDDHEDEETV